MIPMPLRRWITALRIVMALVIVWLSIPTAFPRDPAELARHLGLGVVLRLLAGAEILGALLLLVPRLVRVGAWTLIAVFVVAIAVHLLHGQFHVGPLIIYAMSTAVILAAERARRGVPIPDGLRA
jgi:hypothetical protein